MADESKTSVPKQEPNPTQKPYNPGTEEKQVPAGGEYLKVDNPGAGIGSVGNPKKPYKF